MKSGLILPMLPENLETLRKEEDKIRTQSLLYIDGDAALKNHLGLVHDSLDAIQALTISHVNANDEELVIQRLGIRLFNSGACALSLLLSGYYQNSALLIRDLLETGLLIDYFRSEPAKIKIWRDASDKDREKHFRPAQIRDALDKRDGFKEKKRAAAYRLLSNYAAHPTNPGFKLFSPNWMSEIGPFFDEGYLKALLEELTKRLPASADVYVRFFKVVMPEVDAARRFYLNRLNAWSEKYLGPPNRHQRGTT